MHCSTATIVLLGHHNAPFLINILLKDSWNIALSRAEITVCPYTEKCNNVFPWIIWVNFIYILYWCLVDFTNIIWIIFKWKNYKTKFTWVQWTFCGDSSAVHMCSSASQEKFLETQMCWTIVEQGETVIEWILSCQLQFDCSGHIWVLHPLQIKQYGRWDLYQQMNYIALKSETQMWFKMNCKPFS